MTSYQQRMWRMLVLSCMLDRPIDTIMFRYRMFMESLN
jgi:hypothetical protein